MIKNLLVGRSLTSTLNSSSILCRFGNYYGYSYSTFTHIDADKQQPTMVDVSDKSVTKRTAIARSTIEFPSHVLEQLQGNITSDGGKVKDIVSKKGPVFATSIVAGTMAAKKCWDLIPFCHPIAIESCTFDINIVDKTHVQVDCTVSCSGKTGVEMEALTGASVASLTIYDMCKALSHDIIIKETKLINKLGGKSDINKK
ncbi:hypothetical protein DFA_06972 [Cavenderia fasciculata]|uniref:cyclic pyranopterin monophosphate synthase n=1 Tax=Cavenderia fasciculata TaxID=261658 RepID=F4PX66_CACFS|nr:uncharacterized protein DFA_06972 [Cavenderia fasciculata]EGG19869.1 hypothetical protein DFA_06972 [Cavenderia fasciculata]|eukprot:XP_004358215.1 hypothetical protein DFA_06972 [Cavenderia fasciculata]